MARVIGIDLGTTDSCMAVMEAGEEVVLVPFTSSSKPHPWLGKAAKEAIWRKLCKVAKQ